MSIVHNSEVTALEGLYLCGLIPLLRSRLKGRTCTGLGMSAPSVMTLIFADGRLSLDASPDSPGLAWAGPSSPASPDSPSWEHHLVGARVEEVIQQGADRVLELSFSERTAYDGGGARLVFEMTGRNANIVLVRRNDGRILACLRKVLSSVSRYRTISPGTVYKPPPPSGFPPKDWERSRIEAILGADPGPASLYRNLEGVGPVTAGTILSLPGSTLDNLVELGSRIALGDLIPWETPWGKLPCRLGPGRPVEDPLAPRDTGGGEEKPFRPAAVELRTLLSRALARERKREASIRLSLAKLQGPDDLRTAGGLILTWKSKLRKGMTEATLPHWDGDEITVSLKPSLNPAENAERYFRKAGRIHMESERLQGKLTNSMKRTEELLRELSSMEEISEEEAVRRLQTLSKDRNAPEAGPLEFVLPGGWRCLAGRNAVQNDRLTFRVAARDDIWLHARGVPGAHVIIRRDGRPDNPGQAALEEAAAIAARHSSSNGIIPVDWTLARYVRRMKGGGPGQVTYSREKTVFAES